MACDNWCWMNGFFNNNWLIMRRLVLCVLFFLAFLSLSANIPYESITLEKLYIDRYFRPAGITRGQSMQDGLRYTVIEGRTDLNVVDYRSGSFIETVFTTTGRLTGHDGQSLPIDDYVFSHDETMLLVGVEQESVYRRSRMAAYYIWIIESQTLIPLSEGSKQRLPAFSPDGRFVAFIRDNNIFIKELATLEEMAITTDGAYNMVINGTTDWVYEEEFGFTRAFHWSPDSRRIAYMRFDEAHVREFNMLLYGDLYPADYRYKYPKAGEENARVSVHIFDLPTNTTIVADTGDEDDIYLPGMQWTKDPERLAIRRLNRQQNHLELLLADAATGASSLLYSEHNLYYIDLADDLTFLDDGRHVVLSSEKSGFNHLYLYDMQGREVRALTSGEWDVEKFLAVNEDKGLVYYLARVDSPLENALYSVRLDGRDKVRLTEGAGVHNPSFSNGFHFFINESSTISTPPVYSIHDAEGRLIKVLEDNQVLQERVAAHGFTEPSFFQFTTSEGVDLNGMMILPPDFDAGKTYPLLMYVYGGPGSQTVVNRWNASNGVWFQMLARQGFIVASVDNRGTGFRGEQFRKMTYLELGKLEVSDQVEAASYLGSLDYVDASRIGIFGWSYGGYLSALGLAKGSDQFAAAISVAPVTSWRFYDTIYTERYLRTPQENPGGYDDYSPINLAEQIKGRLLLVHGCADDNVHFQHTVEMASALIKANVQFDLMIYPECNHGIGTPSSRLHLYRYMTDFLLRNLQ